MSAICILISSPPLSTTHRNLNDWTIQLGITRRHSHTYYGQKVKVSRVIPHPHYSYSASHDNDIAMIQVSGESAEWNGYSGWMNRDDK